MPYLVSSIIAVVTAMIILLTRYESDDSAITPEIERTKSMFLAIDGFVNTYIQSGGDLTQINFAELYDDGILLGNITKGNITSKDNVKVVTTKEMESTLNFPNSKIVWQIVPITSDDKGVKIDGVDKDFSKSAGSGYKLFIDFTKNSTLVSKDAFSESFLAREICEKILFGTSIRNATSIATANQTITLTGGTNNDSKMLCIVFK